MTQIELIQVFDTPHDGQYFVKAIVEDVGQPIYPPLYRLDRIPAIPADADKKIYRYTPNAGWQDWSIQAALSAQKQANAELEAEKIKTMRLTDELEAEKTKAEQLTEQMKQSQELLATLNLLSDFASDHTADMTDADVKKLAMFVPNWKANSVQLTAGQVVLGPDSRKPYRVLADVTTEEGKHPEADTEDYKLID